MIEEAAIVYKDNKKWKKKSLNEVFALMLAYPDREMASTYVNDGFFLNCGSLKTERNSQFWTNLLALVRKNFQYFFSGGS
jgi:hypothetical protein